jgi:hypothetical protein
MKRMTMNIQERVQELFNRFNVNLTVTEDKTELAEATLENGTTIYTDAESFSEGAEVYLLNDEGERISLPAGSYELQDGGVLNIGENGVVESVGEAEAVEEATPETEEPQPQTEMETQEEKFDDTPVTREVVAQMIREALAEMMEPGEEKEEEKEEMSAVDPEAPSAALEAVEEPKKAPKKAKKEEAPAEKEEFSILKAELETIKAELASVQKQAAAKGLARVAPTPKVEPIDLKSLTTQERVRALANQFSK